MLWTEGQLLTNPEARISDIMEDGAVINVNLQVRAMIWVWRDVWCAPHPSLSPSMPCPTTGAANSPTANLTHLALSHPTPAKRGVGRRRCAQTLRVGGARLLSLEREQDEGRDRETAPGGSGPGGRAPSGRSLSKAAHSIIISNHNLPRPIFTSMWGLTLSVT